MKLRPNIIGIVAIIYYHHLPYLKPAIPFIPPEAEYIM
jgi:hypothetical protein